ncbi:TetR/AcrR family transcriptional regulator [Bifidobacterium sp.]|jgi:AcrR family transcriptional regulator|uniref:TetR/AcrR family transcriptional regulator n=1 Tax=Bifidobacterium sp. TaxID=41200 RepID=UPI0025C17D52|nr:TetR/AcrR family transcriptional regulator [Bifidobacterium sp.]MCH4209412.1 TetR/AcrR family transcriptional regulator [Bifidobacterium sp.]MCI1224990.1 TetR/AcrR family transcriptional regulator [Bifidobacterium sp.]
MAQSGENNQIERIAQATAHALGRRGYYGTTLQQIADAVGLTKPGLLHYVGNKQGLMQLTLEWYDSSVKVSIVLAQYRTREQDPHAIYSMPSALRGIVQFNALRPDHVRMFSILNAEAISAESPFHEYFQNRDRTLVRDFLNYRWKAPEGTDLAAVLSTAFNAMDGVQIRWLHDPRHTDLNALWRQTERTIFPLPQWEPYM